MLSPLIFPNVYFKNLFIKLLKLCMTFFSPLNMSKLSSGCYGHRDYYKNDINVVFFKWGMFILDWWSCVGRLNGAAFLRKYVTWGGIWEYVTSPHFQSVVSLLPIFCGKCELPASCFCHGWRCHVCLPECPSSRGNGKPKSGFSSMLCFGILSQQTKSNCSTHHVHITVLMVFH